MKTDPDSGANAVPLNSCDKWRSEVVNVNDLYANWAWGEPVNAVPLNSWCVAWGRWVYPSWRQAEPAGTRWSRSSRCPFCLLPVPRYPLTTSFTQCAKSCTTECLKYLVKISNTPCGECFLLNRNRNRNALPIILPPPIYNQKKSSNMGQNTWDKLYFNMWRKHESQISIYIKFLVLQNQIFYKIVIKLKNFDEFFFNSVHLTFYTFILF